MKDDKKVPQLRFPEFTDAWKQRKLCEFVNFYSGLTYKPEDVNQIGTFVLRSSNVKNGEILDADNVYVNEDIAKSEKVQLGDIIVVVRNGSRDLIGKHATVKRSMPNTVIGAFMTGIRAKEYSFVNALLDTNQFEKEINKNLGATINQITGYMFSNMSFTIPSEEEQHKIGSFFTQLDNTITLQQRKLNSLQKLKKGLLQKMFPKNGENIPEIRFPEFSDAWKQRKLSDIALIVGGGTPSTNNPEYWDGEIDWYAPAEINGQIYADYSARKITKLGLEKSSAKILPAGKTVLFTSRAGIGKTAILRRPAATNQGFQSLVLNDEIDAYFVYSMTEIIKQKAEKIASGSTFAEISGKMLGGLSFMFPKYTEQNKIGTFFSKLDNLITLQQRKLEFLQKLKKGLLQQMFI